MILPCEILDSLGRASHRTKKQESFYEALPEHAGHEDLSVRSTNGGSANPYQGPSLADALARSGNTDDFDFEALRLKH